MAHITLRELIANDVETFGYYDAAKLRAKRICFTHYYWLVFGKLPRK